MKRWGILYKYLYIIYNKKALGRENKKNDIYVEVHYHGKEQMLLKCVLLQNSLAQDAPLVKIRSHK